MKNTIQDMVKKIKGWRQRFGLHALPELSDDLFLGFVVVLVALGSFGLGRLSKIEGSKMPIRIEHAPVVTSETFAHETATIGDPSSEPSVEGKGNQLVGSKNGKKYYYVWCSGASRIAEENRIYFISENDARARGYTPSSSCKGL